MVVGFYPPDDRPEESGEHLSVRHILRPTLPHLDLTPVLEAGVENGFVLELTRDIDGRPVDSLHVSGTIDDRQAEKMESFLWSLIPGEPTDHPKLGGFEDADDQPRSSHSLALSQLLITHYLLNAALGHHVI
jgi:phosphoribulokinase